MTRTPTVLLHTDNPAEARGVVVAAHPDLNLEICDSYASLPDAIAQHSPEVIYSVRFAGTSGFPRDAIVESDAVKWLSVGGSGTDHIANWDSTRLTVTNAAGVAADMMAEYTLGAMLHFSLDIAGFARAKNAREWVSGKVAPIAGQCVLILGMGQTGQAIAERCTSMGMRVLGVRARPAPMNNVNEVYGIDALPDLWSKADYIVICVPLLNSTRGMVDAQAIASMHSNAVVIDISRGGVTNQTALAEALSSGNLKGAALDVFETEPLPKESPFWSLENVILTPHCSSVYDGWQLKSLSMFCENLTRYRKGNTLTNIVNPDRGY